LTTSGKEAEEEGIVKIEFGRRIFSSLLFKALKVKAAYCLRNPARLLELIERATRKSDGRNGSSFSDASGSLKAFLRLAGAYARGDYRRISWQSLVLLVATILYFLMPADLLPDFIIGLGLIDDAALIGWTMAFLKKEIDEFLHWEIQENKV
jgi:uncharacterized membrane protein YkvA (DUF1232 family)